MNKLSTKDRARIIAALIEHPRNLSDDWRSKGNCAQALG